MIFSCTELPRKWTVADPAGGLGSSGAWVPVSCRAREDGYSKFGPWNQRILIMLVLKWKAQNSYRKGQNSGPTFKRRGGGPGGGAGGLSICGSRSQLFLHLTLACHYNHTRSTETINKIYARVKSVVFSTLPQSGTTLIIINFRFFSVCVLFCGCSGLLYF